MKNRLFALFFLLLTFCLSGCQSALTPAFVPKDTQHRIVVSVPEQKMRLFDNGNLIATYTISTAKRGIGDLPDSYMTPGGKMEIAEKFGAGMPVGTAFKDRVPTGEIVAIDAPGRDPVVTRILWLRGTEERNQHAYQRYIYIHGTPQESLLGNPASYGCIRMRSADIVELFDKVGIGAEVFVAETEADLPLQQ
ncbi:L,D-transpeptidase [Undibacterium sp. 14-3-2]|uniref:L,D-transpeptidase n=1 Tax=Undibacterium sp. 14-3-2 TaxID=2800129 RepID=UPI0019046A87|nr:L,D-transpeptidase [Undibacterium sp. 14-3-2]MBK1889650.1 L,D-transpeptidase [Undibacterium sp. 14-3-2]